MLDHALGVQQEADALLGLEDLADHALGVRWVVAVVAARHGRDVGLGLVLSADGVRLEKLTVRNADVAIRLEAAGVGGHDAPSLRTEIDSMPAELDDLTRRVGVPCTLLARVYWGTPRPDESAASAEAGGRVHVEGQRLVEWLESRTGTLTPAEVDLVWQAVVVGSRLETGEQAGRSHVKNKGRSTCETMTLVWSTSGFQGFGSRVG